MPINSIRALFKKITPPFSGDKNLLPFRSLSQYSQWLNWSIKENGRFPVEQNNQYVNRNDSSGFLIQGYCLPCNKNSTFSVNMDSGGQHTEQGWRPNWREQMKCPSCEMNSRMRLMARLLQQHLQNKTEQTVYFMEQTTPIMVWAKKKLPSHQITGSEYLGPQYKGGTRIKGIRHEDIENLSFDSECFNFIISNDVFEHVPHPGKAFAECARVLKKGGMMLATIPFNLNAETSVIRAHIRDTEIEHILPPEYHGNPISEEGSLVFTDFGWDMLDSVKQAGFSDISLDFYYAGQFGHGGDPLLVFRLSK